MREIGLNNKRKCHMPRMIIHLCIFLRFLDLPIAFIPETFAFDLKSLLKFIK